MRGGRAVVGDRIGFEGRQFRMPEVAITPIGPIPHSSPASRPTFVGVVHPDTDELEVRVLDDLCDDHLPDEARSPHNDSLAHTHPSVDPHLRSQRTFLAAGGIP